MHPVCSLVASIDLADEVIAEPSESGEDTVECEGVPGHNLAARALAEFRSRAGKELPPLAITIRKRVPVAAGLGGGQRRRRRRAADRERARGAPARPGGAASASPPASAPTCPASSTRGTRSSRAPGERIEPVDLPRSPRS